MALSIGYLHDKTDASVRTVHIGGKERRLSKLFPEHDMSWTIQRVIQADGHELEAIKRQITGIRMTSGRVVQWTGEDCRFIFDNLKL